MVTNKRTIKFAFALFFIVNLLLSCGVITVNAYFPAEEVANVYIELEDLFLRKGRGYKEGKLSLDIKEQIKKEILKFPEVKSAYKSRDSRKSTLRAALSDGILGESNTGLIVERISPVDPRVESLISLENEDRTIVINGMAKAIITVNKIEITPENIKQVYPKASEQFAKMRRLRAPSNVFIQLPDGRWIKK